MEDQMEEETGYVPDKLQSSLIPYGIAIWSFIRAAGWYVLGVLLIIFYTYPYILKTWRKWRLKLDQAEYDAKYHKNPDIGVEMMLSVQEARERMYRQYQISQEMAKEKEEKDKEERHKRKMEELMKHSTGGGHRLGRRNESDDQEPSSSSSSKSKWSKGSFPLMGHGSTSGYKPPKRSACGKGGCG